MAVRIASRVVPLLPLLTHSLRCYAGSFVHLRGSGFDARAAELGYVLCRFNESVSQAIFISAYEIACYSPEMPPALVDLRVTNNLHDYSIDGAVFTYLSMSITQILPVSGLMSGGTRLSISGRNLAVADEVHCAFLFEGIGEILTVATFLALDLLVCTSPTHPTVWPAQTHEAAVVQLIHHESRIHSTIAFTYIEAPEVLALSPNCGPIDGATHLTIRGRGFIDSTRLHCIFHSLGNEAQPLHRVVPAQLLSPSIVSCVSPSAHGRSDVSVRIAADGTMASEEQHFAFHERLHIWQVLPAHGPSRGGSLVVCMAVENECPQRRPGTH
jgi:hypothetical protein